MQSTKQKRSYFLVISIVVIIGFIIGCCVVFTNNHENTVFAQELSKNDLSDTRHHETDAIDVLRSRKTFYSYHLNNAIEEKKKNIAAVISSLDQAIELYERKELAENYTYDTSYLNVGNYNNGNGVAVASGTTDDEYANLISEVIAIATGFEVRGWALAAELLWFNLSNEEFNCDFYPVNGNIIAKETQITEDIAYNKSLSGGYLFDYPGWANGIFAETYQGDLYNSLGTHFYYKKTDAGNGNVKLSILDRYDWAKPTNENDEIVLDNSIMLAEEAVENSGNALVNILIRAEELGVVTPFYTRIDMTLPGYVPFNWEYTRNGVSIKGIANDITDVNIPTEVHDFRARPSQGGNLPKTNVTAIAANAFKEQTQITSINLPITVTTIGNNAFDGCINLSKIDSLSNVTDVGDSAFSRCSALTSLDFPVLVNMGAGAFEGCTSLTNVNLSPAVRIIGDKTFKNCSSLKGITELNSLQFIGMEAFYNCHNMETISLPSTVTYIGEKAFTKCVNLNMLVDNLNPNYSAEKNILYNKERSEIIASGKIESNVRIPNSVAKIGPYAFAGNSNLFNVSMDQAITIGLGAFSDCENLQNASFYSMYLPKLEENAFVNCKFNLYVPYQYQDDYKNLFAEYAPNVNVDSEEVEIQFRNDGQIVETKMVPYGSLVDNATIPVKEGYTFEGWYDSNGEKYIDADGKGVKLIDQKQQLVLESHWAIKSYKIKINGNGYVTWLGPNGLSDEECEIEYGTILSAINLIAEFKATKQAYKEGSVFDHFEYNGNEMAWASIPDLGDDGMVIEIVPQWKLEEHTIHFSTGYEDSVDSITSEYGADIVLPRDLKREGYVFKGWFIAGTENAVTWVTMPDLTPKTDQNTYLKAQNNGSVQLEARWDEIIYRIYYDANGGSGSMAASELSYFSEMKLPICTFTRYGYNFLGWSRSKDNIVEFKNKATVKKLTEQSSITLYACWEQKEIVLTYFAAERDKNGKINLLHGFDPFAYPTVRFGETHTQTAPAYEGYTFSEWQVDSPVAYSVNGASITVTCNYDPVTVNAIPIIAIYTKNACVAEGSLITLADGTQKPVEDLTGEEQLLVWNIYTGQFDSAPILFIDKEPDGQYEVIHLYFSDNTEVKVISEHAFWDINLNEYVFLRKDAAQYLGHWFNKQTFDTNGNMVNASVQLINVVVQKEYTSAWSPVTYGHLCYYVNGMLTMPGATTGLINIFEIDPETMKVDEAAYHRDIEKYGLITYEEFNAKCPLPKEIFEAFGLQNFKVAVGKGLITWEKMEKLIEIYSKFWD